MFVISLTDINWYNVCLYISVHDAKDAWNDYLDTVEDLCRENINSGRNIHKSLCKPQFACKQFAILATEDGWISTARFSIALVLPLTFVVLVLATSNIIIAFFSLIELLGVMFSELSIFAMQGWTFGPSECIGLVIVLAFAVDYVVHLGMCLSPCFYHWSPNIAKNLCFFKSFLT